MGQQILLILHILLALAIIGLVLLQHGKGAEVGAAFGGGASQTLFGSKGSTSFLTKLTAIFALCFAITSLTMGYITTHKEHSQSILQKIEEVQKSEEIPRLPLENKKSINSTNNVNNQGVIKEKNNDKKVDRGEAINKPATTKQKDIILPE